MDWNDSITEWHEVLPEVPVPDSERAVEEWEEEFMHESEREYDRVPTERFWAEDFDLCDSSFIHSLSQDAFNQL
jgi:hypothetical protein